MMILEVEHPLLHSQRPDIHSQHWGAYVCNRHIDRSSTLGFNMQTHDFKGIQSDTQSANRGLVNIPTTACANTLGSAPE